MIKNLFFLIFTLLSTQTLAHTFIGNGGSGVMIGDKVYLRDLFNLGLHETHDFLEKPEPSLNPLFLMRIEPDIPRDLLYRKLTQLNLLCPGLGSLILETIRLYQWIAIDADLTPIADETTPVQLPAGASSVWLANRLGNVVRINRNAWTRMDEHNRAALMIHEAIFSLLDVHSENGLNVQGAAAARELTGSLYLFRYPLESAESVYLRVSKEISLPPLSLMPLLKRGSLWNFEITSIDSPIHLHQSSVPLRYGRDRNRLESLVKEQCQKLKEFQLEYPRAVFKLSGQLTIAEVYFANYQPNVRENRFQLRTKSRAFTSTNIWKPTPAQGTDVESCFNSFQPQIHSALRTTN